MKNQIVKSDSDESETYTVLSFTNNFKDASFQNGIDQPERGLGTLSTGLCALIRHAVHPEY